MHNGGKSRMRGGAITDSASPKGTRAGSYPVLNAPLDAESRLGGSSAQNPGGTGYH